MQVICALGGRCPSLRGALATKQSILRFCRAMDCFAYARNDGVCSYRVGKAAGARERAGKVRVPIIPGKRWARREMRLAPPYGSLAARMECFAGARNGTVST